MDIIKLFLRKSNTPFLLFWVVIISYLPVTNALAQLTMERIDITSNRPNNENHRRDPVRLINNIWWVGHSEVGAFLISTPDGHILMDSTSTHDVNWLIENIVKAGFHLSDIKIILNSHPHEEHIGGLAALRHLLPEAKIITSKETADILATGGKSDFRNILYGENAQLFEPVRVDGAIGHQETVTLGGVTLTAHHTPGHTTGTTTWSMKINYNAKEYDVVFMGGVSTGGDRAPLLKNELYPHIVEDFEESFRYLRSMNCDIYLDARASSIRLNEKLAILNQSDGQTNPFINPDDCRNYINFYEARYRLQLEQEKTAAGL